MIDGDDVTFFALIFSPTTLPGLIVWITILVIGFFVVYNNEQNCEAKTCPSGTTPSLVDGDCMCIQKPLD